MAPTSWAGRPTKREKTTDLTLKHQPASYLRCTEGTSSQRSVALSLFFATEHADNDALGFNNHLFDAFHLVINEGLSERLALATTS